MWCKLNCGNSVLLNFSLISAWSRSFWSFPTKRDFFSSCWAAGLFQRETSSNGAGVRDVIRPERWYFWDTYALWVGVFADVAGVWYVNLQLEEHCKPLFALLWWLVWACFLQLLFFFVYGRIILVAEVGIKQREKWRDICPVKMPQSKCIKIVWSRNGAACSYKWTYPNKNSAQELHYTLFPWLRSLLCWLTSCKILPISVRMECTKPSAVRLYLEFWRNVETLLSPAGVWWQTDRWQCWIAHRSCTVTQAVAVLSTEMQVE